MFNGGSGTAILKSKKTYKDDSWHRVIFSRNMSHGKLVIDDEVISGDSPSPTNRIDMNPPYFIGGVNPEKQSVVLENLVSRSLLSSISKFKNFNLQNTTENFDGCIHNFRMNNRSMEMPEKFDVIPCTENAEYGTYFAAEGGYVRLKDKFKVGPEIDIKMHIKPRNISGLLLAAHGKRDYLVLELVGGSIKLTVDNGRGPISTSFQPSKKHYFCDGEWHNIQGNLMKN